MDIPTIEQVVRAVRATADATHYAAFTGEITAEPAGHRQECDLPDFDHEFVDQRGSEDAFMGTVSYPMGDGRYFVVEFG